MAEPLLRIENLVRRFGGIVATDNLSLDISRGELHAIIGPNGAGKTTLISQLIGQLRPTAGTIRVAGQDVTHLPAWKRSRLGLARSFQITSLLPNFTAADNVALAAQARDSHSFRFFGNARKEKPLRAAAHDDKVVNGILAGGDNVKTVDLHLDGTERDNWAVLGQAHGYQTLPRGELREPWFTNAALLSKCPNLLAVCAYGAGYDTVDVEACTDAGILVCNQSGTNHESVAEHALGVIAHQQELVFEQPQFLIVNPARMCSIQHCFRFFLSRQYACPLLQKCEHC